MKIRSYVVKNYMLRIVCTTVMYGILGYLSFMAKEYIGVFYILLDYREDGKEKPWRNRGFLMF